MVRIQVQLCCYTNLLLMITMMITCAVYYSSQVCVVLTGVHCCRPAVSAVHVSRHASRHLSQNSLRSASQTRPAVYR